VGARDPCPGALASRSSTTTAGCSRQVATLYNTMLAPMAAASLVPVPARACCGVPARAASSAGSGAGVSQALRELNQHPRAGRDVEVS